jgi:hypothetical protein
VHRSTKWLVALIVLLALIPLRRWSPRKTFPRSSLASCAVMARCQIDADGLASNRLQSAAPARRLGRSRVAEDWPGSAELP